VTKITLNRRSLLCGLSTSAALAWLPHSAAAEDDAVPSGGLRADVVIVGGGLGGCAAALAALRGGLTVVLTEETDWIGGQLTQQAVPPDEHGWIESHGCTRTYRELRTGIRDYCRQH